MYINTLLAYQTYLSRLNSEFLFIHTLNNENVVMELNMKSQIA